MLAKNLETFIPLLYTFNVKNTIQLMDDLQDLQFDNDLEFVSCDITNMYTNIPTTELNKIIEVMCKQNVLDKITKNEIIKMCKVLTKQNYFQYRDSQYIQEQCLSMGAPTSSIFSEIYLQYLENTQIYDILMNYRIIGYFRYVDDNLIVHKKELTNIQEILGLFNNMTPTMTFTMEEEINNRISFLYITLTKTDQKISFNIFWKPTTIGIIIPNNSCHPPETKASSG